MKTYLERINEQTPTRMWVNNPTPSEAKKGLEAGTFGATSNPTYLSHMLKAEETKDAALSAIDRYVRMTEDDHLVVALAYQEMIAKIAEIFLPLFQETGGEKGWVAIQGNPYRDDDIDFILQEAHRFYEISPNIVVKVSATLAGIAAMEKLTSEGRCVLATAGVSNYYAVQMFEAYARGVQIAGSAPTLFVTTLAAPFENYAKKYVEANHISISPDLVEKSGTEMSKKIYQICDMHVTCGWNFIDEMNRTNPEILSRIDAMASPEELEELKEKIPAFRRAYEADGLVAADLSSHPAFELFHNGFLTAWDGVLSTVRERRLLLCR